MPDPDSPGTLLSGSDFRVLDDRYLAYLSRGSELRAVSLDRG